MKKYDSYKDSGIEWLKEIPKEWKIARMRYVCDISTGDKDTINKEEKGNYPFFVRSKNIERISTFTYDEEAILTPGDGDICKVWHYINGKFECHQRVYKLAKFHKVTGKFLYYFLMHNFEYEVFKLSAKSTVDSLRRPMFQNFPIAFGSIEEQTAIANYLDQKTTQIDDLIDKKERLIQLLEEERTAIINQAVTKGLDPTVHMKDSGIEWLGEIPAHWEVKKLKYVANLISQKTSEKPEYIIALENIESWTGKIIGNPLENEMQGEAQLFEKGDVLFNKLRPYLAKVTLANKMGGAMGELLILRPNEFITSEFLFQRLRSEMIITVVDGSTYGTKMPRASWDKFISLLEFGVPTIEEQNKIVEFISNNELTIDSITQKYKQEIELLKEYKTALISEVVTGKVDIRNEKLN